MRTFKRSIKNFVRLLFWICLKVLKILENELNKPCQAKSSSNETKAKNEAVTGEQKRENVGDSHKKVNIPEIVRKIEEKIEIIAPNKQFVANNICTPPNMCTPTAICPQMAPIGAPNLINSIMPQHTAPPLGKLHKFRFSSYLPEN